MCEGTARPNVDVLQQPLVINGPDPFSESPKRMENHHLVHILREWFRQHSTMHMTTSKLENSINPQECQRSCQLINPKSPRDHFDASRKNSCSLPYHRALHRFEYPVRVEATLSVVRRDTPLAIESLWGRALWAQSYPGEHLEPHIQP